MSWVGGDAHTIVVEDDELLKIAGQFTVIQIRQSVHGLSEEVRELSASCTDPLRRSRFEVEQFVQVGRDRSRLLRVGFVAELDGQRAADTGQDVEDVRRSNVRRIKDAAQFLDERSTWNGLRCM